MIAIYLTIRKWVPNFIPDESPLKVLTAWVRIPNLSVEYFDTQFLQKVGAKIGKVLRVDRTTAQADRGQFTRISVEIDLTKPLLSKFWLKGKIWKVQYEGTKLICYKCGMMGHSTEHCHQNQEHPCTNGDPGIFEGEHVQRTRTNSSYKPEEVEEFGSWMLVKKPLKKRTPILTKVTPHTNKISEIILPNTSGHVTKSFSTRVPEVPGEKNVDSGRGSRFSVLDFPAEELQEREVVQEAIQEPLAGSKEPLQESTDKTSTNESLGANQFSTINLAEQSQKIPKSSTKAIIFNLGKNLSPKQK